MTKKKQTEGKAAAATAVKKPTAKNVAPKKKDAARAQRGRGKHAEPKPGTECWLYKPIKEEVAILVEKEQPFALVKYPIWAKQVTGRKEYGYELVLVQTKDREDPMNLLSMTKETFYELVEQYEMQQLYRSADGTVYGINTRLRDVHEKLKKLRDKPEKQIKELRAIRINTNYPKEIREKIAEAVDIYRNMLEKSLSEFYKANNVIIWDFATMKPKDVDYEDEEENDD